MHITRGPARHQVRALLAACELPTQDLDTLDLKHFWGLMSERELQGIVGLEVCVEVALLRSLAVADGARGRGVGQALVAEAEAYAQQHGIGALYLLTTTAEAFFERLGYRQHAREAAPPAIRETAEFSGICPSSAVLMAKAL